MTKIYKDAKDVPVAATLIYTDNTGEVAFKDVECTMPFSTEELRDAFLKGCVIAGDDKSSTPDYENDLIKVTRFYLDSGVGCVEYLKYDSAETKVVAFMLSAQDD